MQHNRLHKRPKRRSSLLAIALSTCLTTAAMADHHEMAKASVADLAWMTGSWAGPAGNGVTLEENWVHQKAGTIASLVRMTTADSTPMVELIVIEETEGSLTLHIQQWDPGFKPRPGGPQTMAMTSIGENTVSFATDEPGGLKGLTYTRPTDDTFTIDGVTGEGGTFQITLTAQ